MTTPERRRAPRTASRLSMVLHRDADEIQATTENISASGVYCTLPRYIEPMTKLQVRLQLPAPGGGEIRCRGVIVRSEPASASSHHIAIFFNDLSDRDRATLSRFVQQRLGAPSSSLPR